MSDFVMEIEEGIANAAERIVMYGDGGIGKTTWASGAPRPFILDVERGAKRLAHVGRPVKPILDWYTLIETVKWLIGEKHPYQSVVLDTADRAEYLCWAHICEQESASSIEKVQKGFGKGYVIAQEEFRKLIALFEQLAFERSIHCIVLAHQKADKVHNPAGDDYTRTTMKVHDRVCGAFYDSFDHILHAHRNFVISDDFKDDRSRAIAVGDKRMLRTVGTPTCLAKNRGNVPDVIGLSWHEWACHLANSGFDRLLRDTVRDNARRLGDPEMIAKVDGWIGGASFAALAKMNERLMASQAAKNKQESVTEKELA